MIPIYRAKKIDSDELVEGYFYKIWDKHYILWGTTNGVPNQIEVDPNTLAIHFPNMIDKNGKKIFASLSEDGVGGDVIKSIYHDNVVAFYCSFTNRMEWKKLKSKYDREFCELSSNEIEVIGIHKC